MPPQRRPSRRPAISGLRLISQRVLPGRGQSLSESEHLAIWNSPGSNSDGDDGEDVAGSSVRWLTTDVYCQAAAAGVGVHRA
jgi:hypothetical protein